MHLKMSSAKCRPSCLGLHVLIAGDLSPFWHLYHVNVPYCMSIKLSLLLLSPIYWNTLRPKQNARHLLQTTISMHFVDRFHICILIQISQTFVPKSAIPNKSSLVQVMGGWCRAGNESSSESTMTMMTNFTDVYMHLSLGISVLVKKWSQN